MHRINFRKLCSGLHLLLGSRERENSIYCKPVCAESCASPLQALSFVCSLSTSWEVGYCPCPSLDMRWCHWQSYEGPNTKRIQIKLPQKDIFMIICLKNQATVLRHIVPWCAVHGSGVLCLLGHGQRSVSHGGLGHEMRTRWGRGTHGCITNDSVRRHVV